MFDDLINGLFAALFGADGVSETMPGSSFHALVAAFSTQGYWVHADMLHLVGATQFQHFAVLIYMCAIIGGMVGMALGSPPKMYLWFFMGPAIFHFLVGTTQPVMGVAWKVAGIPQEQTEVWKLAEVGLDNTNIARREGLEVSAYKPPTGGINGNGTVNVSYLFAQLDGLVSDTVQRLISWLGVYNTRGSSDESSNRIPLPSGTQVTNTKEQSRWYLLSNLKWGYLDTITSARLSSVEMRDAFVTFMAGSCGDRFQESIDPSEYASAAKNTSGVISAGLFRYDGTNVNYATKPDEAYKILNEKLLRETMPMPRSLVRLLSTNSATSTPEPGSFREAIDGYMFESVPGPDGSLAVVSGPVNTLLQSAQITCRHYLDLVVRGFRWEAGHVYGQLVGQLPKGMSDSAALDYSLLYGWDIRLLNANELFSVTGNDPFKKLIEEGKGKRLTAEQQTQYIIDLIIINMMKNEFLLVPNKASRLLKSNSVDDATNAIEAYQKTVGSKNKFGEVYTWAMMMPYLQGTLLYLLAIGYPFACMFVLIPGWHKIIFTWASFWIWAKVWDVGFAIVVVLERSIWSTIGNSSRASQLNPFIAQMVEWGKTVVKPVDGSPIPSVTLVDLMPNFTSPDKTQFISYAYLDRAMTLFSNMDLDLQNSYYIYIMAALYFAVPAVTGQLVLGAKAGVAGLVTNAFTSMAQETGSKAGAAFSAGLQKQADQAWAASDQAFKAKALQDRRANSAGGFAAKAFEAEMLGSVAQLNAGAYKQYQDGLQAKGGVLAAARSSAQANMELGNFLPGLIGKDLGSLNPASKLLAPARTFMAGMSTNAMDGVLSATGGREGMPDTLSNLIRDRYGRPPEGGVPSPDGGSVPGDRTNSNFVSPDGGSLQRNAISPGQGAPETVSGTTKQVSNALSNPGTGAVFTFFNQMVSPDFGPIKELATAAGSQFLAQQDAMWRSDSTARSSQLGIDAYLESKDADRYSIASNRYKAVAQGLMQDDSYFDRANYSNQISPTLSAMGVQTQGPGPKADDMMYMATSGLGGSFTTKINGKDEDTIGFAFDGGFMSQTLAGQKHEFREFGFSELKKIYNQNNLSAADMSMLSYGRAASILKAANNKGVAGALLDGPSVFQRANEATKDTMPYVGHGTDTIGAKGPPISKKG